MSNETRNGNSQGSREVNENSLDACFLEILPQNDTMKILKVLGNLLKVLRVPGYFCSEMTKS